MKILFGNHSIKGTYILTFWTLTVFVLFIKQKVFAENIMKAAQYEKGGPEKLTTGEVPIPVPKDHQILIKVYASAINRADTLQRQGRYPPPPGESEILGLEASGIVDKLGPSSSKWKIGDRVMALVSGGGNAEYVTVHEDHVMPVPAGFSLLDAAAIPEVWLTAYQLLHFVGKLQKDETVLIHAGGSGVGTAAVQLTKLAGAVPIVTAGAQSKLDMARSLGAAHGFNYKEENFAEKIQEVTAGKGVNIVLDCVGASYWEKNLASLSMEGRWVLYGLLSGGEVNGAVLAQILRKRVRLEGSTLRTRSNQYKAELIGDFSKNAIPHFTNGTLKQIIDRVYPLDQIADAHRAMEDNVNTGKILLEVRKETPSHGEL